VLAQMLPEGILADSPPEAEHHAGAGRVPVLRVRRWLLADEIATRKLPASWNVTSDSIAAWAAVRLDSRLVLLKSCPFPENADLFNAATWRLVDSCLPSLGAQLRRVDWVDLKSGATKLGIA
jgi:hypothetical protein